MTELALAPKGPFPWDALVAYLRRRSTPGLERFDGGVYHRLTPEGPVTARWTPERDLVPTVPTGRNPDSDRARLARLFQVDQDWTPPEAFLADPALGPLVDRWPGFRPPGCWEPFELVLRTILGQQVSVTAAGTLMARLGERAPTWEPGDIARANLDALGMPGRRVSFLRTFAEAVAAGEVCWTAPWPDLRESLARLPGFGPWTLDYLAIRLGRDLDAFPASDLGLLRGTGCRTPKELLARAETWRPWRGWAASLLWAPSP